MIDIGNKIKELLEQKRLKPTDLARHLGIRKQSAYYILSKPNIDTGQLEKIAEFFSVPMSFFFDSVETEEKNAIAFFLTTLKKYTVNDHLEFLLMPIFYDQLLEVFKKSETLKELYKKHIGPEDEWQKFINDSEPDRLCYAIEKLPDKKKLLFKDIYKSIHEEFQKEIRSNSSIQLLLKNNIFPEYVINTAITRFFIEIRYPVFIDLKAD